MTAGRVVADIREMIKSQLSMVQTGTSNALDLQDCNLSENDLQYIAAIGGKLVVIVKLGNNALNSQAMLHLSKCQWKHLTSIYLTSNKIGNLGCKFLTRGPWRQLKNLHLFNNQIESVGANHLVKGIWKDLELLNLNCNRIGNGLDILMRGNWTSLQRLYLRGNQIDFLLLKRILQAEYPLLNGLWLTHNLENDDERNDMTQRIGQKCKKLTQLIIWE